MRIYHGSRNIIEKPVFGVGNRFNDYGLGFYCTEDIELAKEWACVDGSSIGYANAYLLKTEGLNICNLEDGRYNILNWIALLLENRRFDTTSSMAITAKNYLLENFRVDTGDADVIIGYRADDSYFSFAKDFVNNTISVRQLSRAMRLGNLGTQVVLKSERAFGQLEFLSYETASPEEYYIRRQARDEQAREEYLRGPLRAETLNDDIFVMDIIRRGLKNGDEIL